MNNKNPNVVLLMKDNIDINKFAKEMKNVWNHECKFEISKQANFISYLFEYNKISFVLSLFNKKFPENISKDIANSKYALQAKDIYDCHTNFCMVSVVGELDENINAVYANFTRVIVALLLGYENEKCFIYDIRSRQVIDKQIYLKMLDNMKVWYEEDEDIFPIDWYVNYIIYKIEDNYNGITLGFEAFNDYEIEIHNKKLNPEDLLNIMKYIVLNVVSRQDKIQNRDLIPIPIGEKQDEAIVKQAKSNVLNKETLVIIF